MEGPESSDVVNHGKMNSSLRVRSLLWERAIKSGHRPEFFEISEGLLVMVARILGEIK